MAQLRRTRKEVQGAVDHEVKSMMSAIEGVRELDREERRNVMHSISMHEASLRSMQRGMRKEAKEGLRQMRHAANALAHEQRKAGFSEHVYESEHNEHDYERLNDHVENMQDHLRDAVDHASEHKIGDRLERLMDRAADAHSAVVDGLRQRYHAAAKAGKEASSAARVAEDQVGHILDRIEDKLGQLEKKVDEKDSHAATSHKVSDPKKDTVLAATSSSNSDFSPPQAPVWAAGAAVVAGMAVMLALHVYQRRHIQHPDGFVTLMA